MPARDRGRAERSPPAQRRRAPTASRPARSRTLGLVLQVGEPVRPSRLEPTVAPGLHVLVDLLNRRGIEQHVPRSHALRGPAGPAGAEEAVALKIGDTRAYGPAEAGRGPDDGAPGARAVPR